MPTVEPSEFSAFKRSMIEVPNPSLISNGDTLEYPFDADITLVGGFHYGSPSREVARYALETFGPTDVVAVELCEERVLGAPPVESKESWRSDTLFGNDPKDIDEAEYYFDLFDSLLGVGYSGGEVDFDYEYDAFDLAIEHAKSECGLALIDREWSITQYRQVKLSELSTTIDEYQALYAEYPEAMLRLRDVCRPDGQTRNLIESQYDDIRNLAPEFFKILFREREQHMTLSLINLANRDDVDSIIAIVGVSHLNAIAQYLSNPSQMPEWDFSTDPNPDILYHNHPRQ